MTPPQANSDRSIAVFEVVPSHGAQTQAAADLVDRLRDDTLPEATRGTDLTALVTGTNAVFVDLDERIEDRLPQFIGLVVLIGRDSSGPNSRFSSALGAGLLFALLAKARTNPSVVIPAERRQAREPGPM